MSKMDDVLNDLPKRLETITKQVEKLTTQLGNVNDPTAQTVHKQLQALHKELYTTWDDTLLVMEQVEHLQALIRTSAMITSSLELDQVLEDVLDTIIVLTGAERAMILLTHPEGGELSLQAARDW